MISYRVEQIKRIPDWKSRPELVAEMKTIKATIGFSTLDALHKYRDLVSKEQVEEWRKIIAECESDDR